MKSIEQVKQRLAETEALKAELLNINDDGAIKMVTRLDIKIEELNWILGQE